MSVRGQFLAAVVVAFAANTLSADEMPSASAITFYVYHHNAKGQIIGRPGVEVSRIGPQSEQRLGATSADGEVRIAAQNLFADGAVALLFCDPQFKEHCAALRLESGLLRGLAEFSVQLPIFELVDRVRVRAR